MELISKYAARALDWVIQKVFILIIGKYLKKDIGHILYDRLGNSKGLEMVTNQIIPIPVFL